MHFVAAQFAVEEFVTQSKSAKRLHPRNCSAITSVAESKLAGGAPALQFSFRNDTHEVAHRLSACDCDFAGIRACELERARGTPVESHCAADFRIRNDGRRCEKTCELHKGSVGANAEESAIICS